MQSRLTCPWVAFDWTANPRVEAEQEKELTEEGLNETIFPPKNSESDKTVNIEFWQTISELCRLDPPIGLTVNFQLRLCHFDPS